MGHWLRYFLTSIILLFTTAFPALSEARNLILTDKQGSYDLLPYMAFWEDPAKELTIDQIAAPQNQDKFTLIPGGNANFGFSPSVYWAKISIENHSLKDTWTIMCYTAGDQWVDHIDLYVPCLNNQFFVFRDGETVPTAKTMRPDITIPAFTVKIYPKENKTLYFRIEDEAFTLLPLKIYSEQSIQSRGSLLFFWWLLLGALGFFFFYNILLYFSLRDTIFFFFGLVLLSIPLLYFLSEMGNYFPGLSGWWVNRIKVQGQLYYSAAWLLLIKQYFQIDKHLPRLNRPVWYAIIYHAGLGLMSFILPFHVWSIIKEWSMLFMDLGVVAMIAVIQQKDLADGRRLFIVAAMSAYALAVCINLDMLNIVSFTLCRTPDLRIFALLGMLLIFSFALIDRYSVLSRRTIAAQQRAVAEMQQAERAKDDFLANTSHELRTPLHGIIGICEDLLAPSRSGNACAAFEKLNVIHHSAHRLSALIDDLLDFSQMKQGTIQIALGPVEMSAVAATVLALCRPMIGRKQIRLESDLPDGHVWVWADENRVQQILLNLVRNAVKFTETGKIQISGKMENNHFKVAVRDTGIGIPGEQLALVFDRFQQLDGASDRQYDGLGLGLAISKQLVELQDGQIAVESKPGKGSNFSFTLPLAKNHQTEVPKAVIEPVPVGNDGASFMLPVLPLPTRPEVLAGSPCILIVDDDPISLYTLHNYLDTAGYQVMTAQDALAAREIIDHHAPDLIILDIMMPRMNGYQLCQNIRRKYDPTELPVIMLTARTQTKDIVRGFECGANDYVAKPVHRQELMARIQSTLRFKASTDLLRENKELKEQIIRRKKAENDLAQINRQLTQLLDLWEDGLILADTLGRIRFFNKGAESLFGCQAHQIVTHSIERIFTHHTQILNGFKRSGGWFAPEQINLHTQYYQMPGRKTDGDTPIQLDITTMPIPFEGELVFALICKEASAPSNGAAHAAKELARSQQKIQAMQAAFDNLKHHINQEASHLVGELDVIDQTTVDIFAQLTGQEIETLYKQTIVEMMNCALNCWCESAGKNKIDLAEESGIWRAYLDNGTYKTRTLDKYLDVGKLPKRPRINEVLQTVEFVSRRCDQNHAAFKTLQYTRTKLMAISKARKECQNGVKNCFQSTPC